jgi:GST-like protein
MNLVLHYAPMSSALPVACALAELGVPHERVTHDIRTSAHRTPEFLALNPNGKVPTLVVDGAPMFEALAILQWLGGRFGVARGLWPAEDTPARLRALSWSAWAYVTYAAQLMRVGHAASDRSPPELRSEVHAAHAREELARLGKILDGELERSPYLLGDSYSLADLIVSSVVDYGTYCGATLEGLPHAKAWLARCQDRPAVRAEWGRP